MKAYGYIRTSTQDQKISLSLQEEKIRQYAALNDLELTEIIKDEKSGKNLKREGINRLLGKLQAGNQLIVYKLDRLSRSTRDTLRLIDDFGKKRITFHSIQENLDTESAIGRFVVKIISALAEMERELISERTKDALQELKTSGKVYGTTPFGYNRQGNDLIPNKEEQKVIKGMIQMRDNGMTLQAIADHLNELQISTKNGSAKWCAKKVQKIIERSKEVINA
jgi:DNA invertase Pin-like site-specific DNA recombinase